MVDKTDDFKSNTMVADYPEDPEMATNRLTGTLSDAKSAPPQAGQEQFDWLTRLTTQNINTGLLEETPPQPWEPSGMSQHTVAPRMVPTIGARLTRKLRRTALLATLAMLLVGAVAGGIYVLSSTTWFTSLMEPQPQNGTASTGAQPPAQQPRASAPLPDVAQGGAQPVIEAPVTGTTKQLSEQGIAQIKAGNYDEAIRLLEASSIMPGADAVTYYQLGLAYMASTRHEHALEDAEMAFRSAASLQPAWGAPLQGVAESLIRRGFYRQAVQPALEATRLDPSPAEAWMTLGRAYEGAGQKTEATKAFAEAARHSPPPPTKP